MEDTLSAINGRRRRREAMNGPLAQRAFTPASFYPGLSRPGRLLTILENCIKAETLHLAFIRCKKPGWVFPIPASIRETRASYCQHMTCTLRALCGGVGPARAAAHGQRGGHQLL